MQSDGFTIRIHVPDGDPEGVRFIDPMTSTRLAISFPRARWPDIRLRPEFQRAGIYVLSGYSPGKSDLPTLYIGQSDGVLDRIDSHHERKDFWDRGFVFVTKSSDSGFNKAHVIWLEHKLIVHARQAGRSYVENNVTPSEPTFSQADRTDTRLFLTEILQVLPLVGLRAFEIPIPVATPTITGPMTPEQANEPDTIVVPALGDGFEEVFLAQNAWWEVRIGAGMIPKIKYIAAYQSKPVSAVTHVAPVASIEPYGEDGKYKLNFSEPAKAVGPIPFRDAPSGSMQGPRYTTYARLMTAKKVTDLFRE